MNDVFEFKHFAIRQDSCGMKVGTDGVLLGAWADGGHRILDIGAGTGVLSLMMAQRFNSSNIIGIDIDSEACIQAAENVNMSEFRDRINIINISFQHFVNMQKDKKEEPFDAIVSNPPFFIKSLQSDIIQRNIARHTSTLSHEELLEGVSMILSKNGIFSTIIPFNYVDDFLYKSRLCELYCYRHTLIRTVDSKFPKRHLMSFMKKEPKSVIKDTVCLSNHKGERSIWYKKITKDFYLH